MHHRRRHGGPLATLVLLLLAGIRPGPPGTFGPGPARAATDPQDAPLRLDPILPVDQVRSGMAGYGLSVFRGSRIEPFAIEVLSVMHDAGPDRSAVWIRCTDPELRRIGPVAGMSGSPVYLWGDDEPHVLGHGGRLIGAYAFGFAGSRDAIVGVQPIEVMRAIAGRADAPSEPASAMRAAGDADPAPLLQALLSAAGEARLHERTTWRARVLADWAAERTAPVTAHAGQAPATGSARPLHLPMMMRSASLAEAMGPVLATLGLRAVSGGAAGARPPDWIRPDAIRLEPGAVLSVPLTFGDLDLAASGTVTEVWPDGRVLAFGHGMSGMGGQSDTGGGPIAMPMATGFVHFVQPGLLGSFKLGGTARVRGGLVRDETAAVIGRPDGRFETAPVHVEVRMAGQPVRSYDYEVVHDPKLTPVLAAIVVGESVAAEQNPPDQNTIRLSGRIDFGAGRVLELDSWMPAGNALATVIELVPPMTMMARNPFESVLARDVRVRVDVEPDVRLASLTHGRLDHAELAPGDALGITVRLQPYRAAAVEQRLELPIPDFAPEGQYDLLICDARTYLKRLMRNRPHLRAATSVDQLFAFIKRVTRVKADALYVVMDLPGAGLAVGQQELPNLPSSRAAMMATPTSTLATPFREWVETRTRMPFMTEGALKFKITLSRTLADR